MTKRLLFFLDVAEPLNASAVLSFGHPGPWTGVCGRGSLGEGPSGEPNFLRCSGRDQHLTNLCPAHPLQASDLGGFWKILKAGMDCPEVL